MKSIKLILTTTLVVVLSMGLFAQTKKTSINAATKTETLKVGGNCDMCKARIEKAAKMVGVIKSDWKIKTKELTLVYDPSKVKSIDVQKAIAAVGHDTPKFKASQKAYDALPGCCKYR